MQASLLILQILGQNNISIHFKLYLDIWSCDNVNRKWLQINEGAEIVLEKNSTVFPLQKAIFLQGDWNSV